MVLVGPSGCGKSTLLRMIAGLEAVSSGTIRIGDREVTELAPRSRDVAMVFQNYALYPHMRVWDNLAFALKLRKTPKPAMREQVGEVAGMLGLKELLERKPGALSGGQRQRVAIGRAMVREPQAFLMDEPLSNLDAKLRVGMRAELARLHDRLGVTTVYVTHDQVEAMTLGDRVAVLRDGTVQQCDTPERLFDAPANVFVAAFMGSPPMNLVAGELREGRLRMAGVEVPLAAERRAPRRRDGARGDGPVIAGVRPTDLKPRAGRDPALPRLRAELEVVERLGSREPPDLPGRRAEAVGRGGRRRRRGDRGERRHAARRRQPRPLHRARRGPPALHAGRRAEFTSCRPTRCTCSIPRPGSRCGSERRSAQPPALPPRLQEAPLGRVLGRGDRRVVGGGGLGVGRPRRRSRSARMAWKRW